MPYPTLPRYPLLCSLLSVERDKMTWKQTSLWEHQIMRSLYRGRAISLLSFKSTLTTKAHIESMSIVTILNAFQKSYPYLMRLYRRSDISSGKRPKLSLRPPITTRSTTTRPIDPFRFDDCVMCGRESAYARKDGKYYCTDCWQVWNS